MEITEEEYKLLLPYQNELFIGNWPTEVWDLLLDLENKSRPVTIREFNNLGKVDIYVAIC